MGKIFKIGVRDSWGKSREEEGEMGSHNFKQKHFNLRKFKPGEPLSDLLPGIKNKAGCEYHRRITPIPISVFLSTHLDFLRLFPLLGRVFWKKGC